MLERSALQPDLARATRAASAFSAALLICAWLGAPLASQYAATAALAVSMPQLRGAYPQRVLVMAVMITVISCSALMGGLVAGHIFAAVAGMGVLALLSGLWRHLSPDYGPPVAIDSALLYLLALEGPAHGATPPEMALWVALGGSGAALLQLGLWGFRPQHPLRHAVAEAWVATSDLYLSLLPASPTEPPSKEAWVMKQRLLRESLDRATAALNAARTRSQPQLIQHLERMLREAAHLAMQMSAVHTAREARNDAGLQEPPSLTAAREAVLRELANLARSVAITLITHRPRNLELTRARIQTAQNLMAVLLQELRETGDVSGGPGVASSNLSGMVKAMQDQLGSVVEALAPTVEHSETPSPLPLHLPDLSRASMPAIAAWLNSVPFPDPVLVRYALRVGLLTMVAVGVYLHLHLPRGYWMAFAIIVVLQPDYGATRLRALQRVTGTVGGALLASGLLYVPLPYWLLGMLTAAMAFTFAYFLKRNYGLAVFFVTIMIVLITELHMPVHLDFTTGRLLSNLAGAALAFMAAAWFWPASERKRFPGLMAGAIRANDTYFGLAAHEFTASEGRFHPVLLKAKQEAERAGAKAAASLQRWIAEPGFPSEVKPCATGLVTGNDRVTRAINLLVIQMESGVTAAGQNCAATTAEIHQTLADLAGKAEHQAWSRNGCPPRTGEPGSAIPAPLLTVLTEVRAMGVGE
ncbi:MAG: FUSC family protein [Verrucomicrobium sp.]